MNKLSLLVLLVLATAYAVADNDCDFQFYRNAEGSLARLDLGYYYQSVIEVSKDSSWKSYVKYGNNLTVTDQTGASSVEDFSELPEEERTRLNELLKQKVTGYKVLSHGGGLEIGWNSSLQLKSFNEEDFSVSIKSVGWYASLRASSTAKYHHVFFLSNSAVILLDRLCEEPKYLPFKDLDSDIQNVLNKIIHRPDNVL